MKVQTSIYVDLEDLEYCKENELKFGYVFLEGLKSIKAREEASGDFDTLKLKVEKMAQMLADLRLENFAIRDSLGKK